MLTISFEQVEALSATFIGRLGLPLEAEPNLDKLLTGLRAKLDIEKPKLAASLDALELTESYRGRVSSGNTGLNTIGMLSDRLTILLMKEWCLLNRGKKDAQLAQNLRQLQIKDIVGALNIALPGSASTHAKITNLRGGATASTWGEAFAGLLCANILLWESQEILYVHDIKLLPPEQLRQYISWFAIGNMLRNEQIQLLEQYFWAKSI